MRARGVGRSGSRAKARAPTHCAVHRQAPDHPHASQRIAPHSDYGVLTLLKADDAPGGLEVLRSDGSWSPVVIPPDCFCVNLGDLMQRALTPCRPHTGPHTASQ